MAAFNPKITTPNTITGKIILKETGVGIPDLLVVIYDLDPGARQEEDFREAAASGALSIAGINPLQADRIGSVLSNADGSWSLTYEDIEFDSDSPSEKRPDLQLLVLAPEDADSGKPPIVLFSSKLLRVNSGRTESYMIRVSSKQLIKAEIPIPNGNGETGTTEQKIKQYWESKKIQKDLKDGIKLINKEFENLEIGQKEELRKTIKGVILPDVEIHNSMYNFVKETETVEEVQNKVFQTGADFIDSRITPPSTPEPGKGIKVNLMLTQADIEDLAPFKFTLDGKDYFNIPEAKIQQLLFKREEDEGINSILFSNNPISKYCIQKSTSDKCALVHAGIDTGTGHDTEGGNPPSTPPTESTGMTNTDIPIYLQNILASKDSNQFHDGKDYSSQRPDDKSVQSRVDNFALQKGPADTTAFYDFHSLQIAFEYVWEQLLDQTIVNLSEKIDNDLESAGKKGLLQSIKERFTDIKFAGPKTLLASAQVAQYFTVQEVPTEIASAFDISFIEYDALNQNDKTRLLDISKEINAKELNPAYATYASILRDQGERIIDNIRVNKPFTTNQLLRELQEKLMSKYEFTVFGADRNYHSINFGLMNTFRQKWEPISYQAGKLVKTIPLSPKEERKYSVKTVENTKITKKEAQKNNSSLHNEINITSRAEQEIIAKAHDKSNFNMSVKLDYSKISSTVTFGKDAEKESSQAKKDFREAVIKASQEYKEERSIEVDTEATFNAEYNESGTIVNPNDELSVTYLFYELQRRYRISEQLYRVMPVVMVAQEVPTPDQINEGWIVANDWILNRVLLDDSFRETLQYIAQKNVGDDFAIRELRKNLRQQRTLVNNLQIEFSKLKIEVENKYEALNARIDERISEEHKKRFYHWYFFNDDKPDPEMAKAKEQAAADEHQYAVEKAEKMALAVQREVNALHQLTMDYNKMMQEHLDRLTQCRRLIAHIKSNILYYMQAIWSMEPPDQRYMRLYKVKVPHFEADRTCIVEADITEDIFAQFRKDGKEKHQAWLHGKIKRKNDGTPDITYKQLVEVADLDMLLGFKGNYMIFPLKEHNALTEFMAAPYIDEAFGAMDPDQLSNINLEEFSKYICCLHDEDPDLFEELQPVLRTWLEKLLADPLRNGDEIIIPTGSLFIEMLPSDKSLLEDFKLKHREWDVYKVQAEVRKMELENIRYATRLLKDETEDPDIEKQIIFNGDGHPHVDVDI